MSPPRRERGVALFALALFFKAVPDAEVAAAALDTFLVAAAEVLRSDDDVVALCAGLALDAALGSVWATTLSRVTSREESRLGDHTTQRVRGTPPPGDSRRRENDERRGPRLEPMTSDTPESVVDRES